MLFQDSLILLQKHNIIDRRIYGFLRFYEKNYEELLWSDIDELKDPKSIYLINHLISMGKLLAHHLNGKIKFSTSLSFEEKLDISLKLEYVKEKIDKKNKKISATFHDELLDNLNDTEVLSLLIMLNNTLKKHSPFMAENSISSCTNNKIIQRVVNYLDKFIDAANANNFLDAPHQYLRNAKTCIDRFILPSMMATDVLHDQGIYRLFIALESTSRWLDATHKRLQANQSSTSTELMASSSAYPICSSADIPRPHSSQASVSNCSMWHKSDVMPRSSSTPLLSSSTEPMRSPIAREPLKPSPLRICSRYPG